MFSDKTIYLGLFFLGLLTVLLWSAVFEAIPNGILEISFFDVGQGDSILLELDQNKQVLIDGGPDKLIMEKLSEEMPFYDKTIELLILTHPDKDHITGLVSVLEFFNIGHILTGGAETDTIVYKKWRELVSEKQIPVSSAGAGQKIILDNSIALEVLWPETESHNGFYKANNKSVVLKLNYGEVDVLLTGDIEKKIERILVDQFGESLESDILKVAHHGSKSSSIEDFLNQVKPVASIISAGEDNWYGHPHDPVLRRLGQFCETIYRTDKQGTIKILTDGKGVDIKVAGK